MQNRRLWFGNVDSKDESAWLRICRAVEVKGRGGQKKTWVEVIRNDLRERGASKDLAKMGQLGSHLQNPVQRMLACKRDVKRR